MNIELRPAETIAIDENNPPIVSVNDIFERSLITARVQGVYRDIVLWSGQEEYALAGNWTSESVADRLKELLLTNTINFS